MVTESVAAANTQIVLVPHAVLKRKKVVAVSLTAEVEPLAPGGGVPSGVVTFIMVQKKTRKTLGTAALNGGQATLTLKPASVLNKSITITYGGAGGFQSAVLAPLRLTSRSLASAARLAPKEHPAARKAATMVVPAGPGRHHLSLISR